MSHLGDASPSAPGGSPLEPAIAVRRVRDARQLALALGALGVVYGDLGTSPLYAMRECFASAHGLALAPANVFGSVSLALWSILLLVSLKYTVFILRADNEGEGGTLALLAKIPTRQLKGLLPARPLFLVVVLLFGSALLVGDGIVLGRDSLRLEQEHGPLSIPRRVFAFLSRNQAPAFGYFGMPVENVIEIGMHIEL